MFIICAISEKLNHHTFDTRLSKGGGLLSSIDTYKSLKLKMPVCKIKKLNGAP